LPVSASQTLTVALEAQTISNFGALLTYTFSGSHIEFSVGATASSGMHVSYSSSNSAVATASGNNITIVGAGSSTITASQAGGNNYAPVSAGQTLTVAKAALAREE
jgi:hypothetical protein